MVVHTDAAVLGKLGEFGQAVMRKKADQVMKQFGDNMAAKLAGSNGDAEVAPAESVAPAGVTAAPAEAAPAPAPAPSPKPQAAAPAPAAAKSPAAPAARPGLFARIGAWFRARRARRG
jgi:hypothetical protein